MRTYTAKNSSWNVRSRFNVVPCIYLFSWKKKTKTTHTKLRSTNYFLRIKKHPVTSNVFFYGNVIRSSTHGRPTEQCARRLTRQNCNVNPSHAIVCVIFLFFRFVFDELVDFSHTGLLFYHSSLGPPPSPWLSSIHTIPHALTPSSVNFYSCPLFPRRFNLWHLSS